MLPMSTWLLLPSFRGIEFLLLVIVRFGSGCPPVLLDQLAGRLPLLSLPPQSRGEGKKALLSLPSSRLRGRRGLRHTREQQIHSAALFTLPPALRGEGRVGGIA